MSPALRLFLAFWSALWTAGLPLVLFYLWRRGRRDPAYLSHLSERFGRHARPMPGAVWIHAVSLGEMRSAVPLVRALLARGDRVVTTHFTPAGRGEAERVFAAEIANGRMQAVWVPFETDWAYRGFFRTFRPAVGLVMEIEIWPRMVFAARKAGVPLYLCNAQYPQKSLQRDGRGLRLRQQIMRACAGALVKSAEQARRFAGIGVENIRVTGELRFDQPIPEAQLAAGADLRQRLGARPVITVASAIEGEDEIYVAALTALREGRRDQDPAPLVVYVPRRPERFDEVEAFLSRAGLRVARRSRALGPGLECPAGLSPEDWDVLLGDSLGEMYFYLSLADRVVVGGGFNPKGAHNIIEPLALRKPVLTGPHVGTIEYPFVEAEAAGVARKVADANDLSAALREGFSPDPARIESFFKEHSGATARTLAALDDLLRSVRPS